MPNVAEIIKDHVTLEVRCLDRLYLNAYIPRLQSSGGVIDFLVRACRQKIASPAIFGQLTDAFNARLRRWATEQQIPWIEFRKGERKDTVVQRYREKFRKPSGVVVIGVAQERASAWAATKQRRGRFVDFVYFRKSVCPTHYYMYVIDPEWGPAFIKVCGYAPYAIKICLNGHEWAKRQLVRGELQIREHFRRFRDVARIMACAIWPSGFCICWRRSPDSPVRAARVPSWPNPCSSSNNC